MEETLETETKDLTISAQKVHEEVLRSMRGSIDHLKYATPRVQLAWGHSSQDGRIHHVRSVENGRNCECVCPACRETLVARQGAVRAWHFAHHNGKECRNAVSAAIAKFLAQWLSDGKGLDLPDVHFIFAGERHTRGGRAGMTFDRATAREGEGEQVWEVHAEKDVGDETNALRIFIRTNPRAELPDLGRCRQENISTMVIELGSVLSVALEVDPDLCTDEDWMTTQVVAEAPRAWIWTAAADRLRKSAIDTHIGPYLSALERAKENAIEAGVVTPAQAIVTEMGYVDLISAQGGEGADVDGAFIFSRSAMQWRAEIFLELILRPIARAWPGAPTYPQTVIGWRNSGAACRRLDLVPGPFLKRVEPGHMIELRTALPGFREPVKVIDSYLDDLVDAGVLRKRPSKRVDARQTDRFDAELWNIKGGSYSFAPRFIAEVSSRLGETPELCDHIMKGLSPKA